MPARPKIRLSLVKRLCLPALAPAIVVAWAVLLVVVDHPQPASIREALDIAWLPVAIIAVIFLTRSTHRDLHTARRRIRQLETELTEANTDPVTGLAVRRLAERHIAAAIGRPLTVAVIDVDDMHRINNTHGHQYGDAYLADIADRLQQLAEPGDLVARLGGDEFVVVTTRTPDTLADALADATHRPAARTDHAEALHLSIGICHLRGGDAHTALGRADLAMYTAKRRRTGIEHYHPARDGMPQPRDVRPQARPRDRRPGDGPPTIA